MENNLKNITLKYVVFENSGLNKAVGSRRSHALIILNMLSILFFVLGNDNFRVATCTQGRTL